MRVSGKTVTMSGPGVEREYRVAEFNSEETACAVARSAAITFASKKGEPEATFYVRDARGDTRAIVERRAGGTVEVWMEGGH